MFIDLSRKEEFFEETSIVLVGENTAYVELFNDNHRCQLKEYYLDFEVVDDLTLITEEIVKVTYLNLENIHTMYDQHLGPMFDEDVNIVLSGEIWIDAMNKNVNKANGLKIILNHYNLNPSNLIAFGDYHNDIQMLELANKSYAVANAHPDVKIIADEIIENNDTNSVLRKIEEYLD